MLSSDSPKGWTWYREACFAALRSSEPEALPLLALLETGDKILRDLLDRPTSFASDRPQDYIVSVLSVRSFRLCVASLFLEMLGYSDVATSVNRSNWEICIRLLDILEEPVQASLGFMLRGASDEIRTMEWELSHRQKNQLPNRHLEQNLKTWREHHGLLMTIATQRGYDPASIRKKHGKLNVRQVCEHHGVEKAYHVDYVFGSLYEHSYMASLDGIIQDGPDQRTFVLGPVGQDYAAGTADALINYSKVLSLGAHILDDSSLIERTDSFLARVFEVIDAQIGAKDS